MPGNVRIFPNQTYDSGFLNQALGSMGITTILTEPNGTVEVNMTDDQLVDFQTRYPQYQVAQVTPVAADQPAADAYVDQAAAPTSDPGLEGGESVQTDPTPN